MYEQFGQQALFSMVSHLFFIGLTFWSLQALRYEQVLKANHIVQARLLFILLSLAIGSTVSNFFLDYFVWSRQLPLLF
nr:DUF1146 family protein [Bacillus ectoiniformans]